MTEPKRHPPELLEKFLVSWNRFYPEGPPPKNVQITSKIQTHPIEIDGEIARVLLSNGECAIIDAEDSYLADGVRWTGNKNSYGKTYACFKTLLGDIYLHRLVMNAPKGMEVDHINGNTLDARKGNLRICTRSENAMNRGLFSNTTTGVKGVTWVSDHKKYRAQIVLDRKLIFLGYFSTVEDAANARAKAAALLHGEFARDKWDHQAA